MTDASVATPAKAAPKKAVTPKAKKPVKAASSSSHPPYKSMIKKAVAELKDKNGSSRAAIIKYVSSNYKVQGNVSIQVRQALKRMVAKKELVHASSKSQGANGSFKLPAKEPKAKKPVKAASKAKSPKAKKPSAAKKAKSPAKPKAASAAKPKKSPAKKKAAPAKKAAASKSPAKPKAKKPAAKKAPAKK